MSDRAQDLARGLYGRATPVRPAPRDISPPACLRGHDLKLATARSGYNHRYGLTELTCNVCHELHDERASWCLIDPAKQHQEDGAPTEGFVLVRIPPAERGGLGQLQLRLDGVPLADLDLAVCGPCRRAVLEQVRVDEGTATRRRGYGRVLVAAALAMASPAEYRWSTTSVTNDPVARAFWAGIGRPGALGTPDYCSDMDRAAGRSPDY